MRFLLAGAPGIILNSRMEHEGAPAPPLRTSPPPSHSRARQGRCAPVPGAFGILDKLFVSGLFPLSRKGVTRLPGAFPFVRNTSCRYSSLLLCWTRNLQVIQDASRSLLGKRRPACFLVGRLAALHPRTVVAVNFDYLAFFEYNSAEAADQETAATPEAPATAMRSNAPAPSAWRCAPAVDAKPQSAFRVPSLSLPRRLCIPEQPC